jgi:hypothetical protein
MGTRKKSTKQNPQEGTVEKAVAVKEANQPQVAGESLSSWGQAPQMSSNDIIMPRINLMQPMSDKVTAGEAAFGDFRDSLNNELIAKMGEKFKVIPFHLQKIFIVYNVTDRDQKDYLRTESISAENDNAKYEDEERGKDGKTIKIQRDRVMNFFVLRPEEIAVGSAIPYIMSFRRSSMQAGKKLATQMYMKNMAAGKSPPAVTMVVTAKKESNDKGTYAVIDIVPTGPTSPEHIAEAFKWFQLVNAGKARAHEGLEEETVEAAAPAGAPVAKSNASVERGPERF